MNEVKVLFAIPSYTHGLAGRKYKNMREAIKDGTYDAWTDERIKLAFNFGNGTLKDLKRFCKDNKEKIISSECFYKILNSLNLSTTELMMHNDFIESMVHLSYRK